MISLEDIVVPYKGRKVDPKHRVEIYRNLTRKDGVWYSVRQGGRVVGHTKWIRLKECYFKANESGRQRVLKTGHRNVHAYVIGYMIPRLRQDLGDGMEGRYNPREMEKFCYRVLGGAWQPVICAMQAELNAHGLTVWMPRA